MPNPTPIRQIHPDLRPANDENGRLIAFDPEALVNIDVASKTLTISKKTLYKYCEQRLIEHYAIGRRLRFDRSALARFLEKHKVKQIDPAVGGGK